MKKYLFASMALLAGFNSHAVTYVGSDMTTVKFITSYNQYGPGDVMFKIKDPIAECTGYYIRNTDEGYHSNLSMMIAAFHANSKVRIYGIPEERWSGSGAHICKLYSIEYHK